MNRGLLGWGLFFIILGAVPLAVRSGLVDESVVVRAWELWPLIIIGIGLGLLLSRTKAAALGGLVVAVTAGLMAGGVVAAGLSGFAGFGDPFGACTFRSDEGEPFQEQRGILGTDAQVRVVLDCGQVRIDPVAGDGWTVSGRSVDGEVPDIDAGDRELSVRAPDRGRFGRAGGEWNVRLPQAPATRLDLSVNAGSAVADLAGMTLTRVDASVNAGSATLDLSQAIRLDRIDADVNAGSLAVSLPAADVTGDLTANAGSIEVCVPDGVDLRIRLEDNALGSNNFAEEGLVQRGDTWESPDFGGAGATIDISAGANLGSIDLNPEDGCAE